MKKKIILSLTIIAMLICVFAISVSAENRTSISYTDFDGNVHTVPIVKYEDATVQSVTEAIKTGDSRGHTCSIAGTERVKDNGSYAIVMDSNGELTAYPSWYIIDVTGDTGWAEVYEIGYGYLNEKSGKTYTDGAIRYIEFPNGITAIRNNSVFGGGATAGKYESNVTEMYLPSSVTVIRGGSLALAPSLKKVYIAENSQMTSINDEAFSDCAYLEYVQFENLSLLTDIDGFRGCEKLSCDLDLSNCTSLKSIGSKAFCQTDIRKITLPDSVEIIDSDAFAYCPNGYLSSSYLPSNLKTVGALFFAYNNNLLDTYVFPEGVKSIGNEPFQDSKVTGGPTGKKLNLVFLGEVTGVVYLNGNGHQKHAEEVTVYFAKNTVSQYNTNGFKVKPSGSSYTDVERAIRVVFCNDNNSADLIYLTNTDGTSWQEGEFVMDGHTHFGSCSVVENTCGKDGSETVSCIICDTNIITVLEATNEHNYVEGVCTVCEKTLCPGGGEHNMKRVVIFDNGFMSDGRITSKCQIEGCTHEVKERDLSPIFKLLGYSAKINGDKITVSYVVCRESLEIYEEISGTKLQYGVVASKPNESPISINNGELSCGDGVVMAAVKNDYVAFDFIMSGFTERHYEKSIVMCAYVYDGKEVNYLCINDNNEVGQFEKPYTVIFNTWAI